MDREIQNLMRLLADRCEKTGIGCDVDAHFWKRNWKEHFSIERKEKDDGCDNCEVTNPGQPTCKEME